MNFTMTPNQIIDALGGTAKVARIFNISDAAVSQWREDGIPESRMMYLRLAYPKLFKEPKQPVSA